MKPDIICLTVDGLKIGINSRGRQVRLPSYQKIFDFLFTAGNR